MPDVVTPELDLVKPGINESEDTWGAKLNANLDAIDAAVASDRARIAALEARLTAAEAEARRASFVGEIRIWSGAIADIPNIPGGVWQLCDGTNGTLDLRDRFIVGSGLNYPQWSAGGSTSWTGKVGTRIMQGLRAIGHVLTLGQMPAHNHGGRTTDDGWHSHRFGALSGGRGGPGSYSDVWGLDTRDTEGAGVHFHWFETDWRGGNEAHDHALPDLTHDHDVTVQTTPPYYALAYIRRMR